MGADLIVTYTKAPRAALMLPVSIEQVIAVGKARIAAFPFEGFSIEDVFEWIEEDFPESVEDDLTFGRAKDILRERASDALDRLYAGGRLARDVRFLVFDERSYLLTGGLSTGDTPTDSFDDLELIARFGVFNADITQAELDAL